MPLASSRRLRRLLVGSGGPRRRCNRRRKSCVRIKNGSAFSARVSIRQTAGLGGRAGKKSSSARAGSNSRPQSSSSTVTGYNGTGKLTVDSSRLTARERREGGGPPSPFFSELHILMGFKSCVLKLRILQELPARFAEPRIPKG